MYLDPSLVANALAVGNLKGPEDRQWKPIMIPNIKTETNIEPTEYIGDTIFRGVDRLKLISSIISGRKEDGGCQLNTDRLIKDGNLLAFFPLHDLPELRALENEWMVRVNF